jgi:hypothetical protein
VKKMLLAAATPVFLAAASSVFAQSPLSSTPLRPEVRISVHDYAGVSTALLTAAEDQAREVFRRAGLETVWLNCSPKLEKHEPESCHFADATHLTLKISPRAMNAQVRDRIDVLGTSYPDEQGGGYFAYVFYDRVQELAERRTLGHALLADVMAHEIGHLLLGSNSHSVSGIMCARWDAEQLRNVAEGRVSFAPSESRRMREHVYSRQSAQAKLAPVAPQQEALTATSAAPR